MKILFIAADPRSRQQLAVTEEYRLIQHSIRASRFRDAFTVVTELAARPGDLRRALLEHRPDVVHITCHGSGNAELLLVQDDDSSVAVDAATLVSYFRILRDNIALVVLNACFTSAPAAAIRDTVGLAIGMRQRISDAAAIRFSAAFYESLAYGRSVRAAFELGRAATGPGQREVPELFARDEAAAMHTCLVGGVAAGGRPPWTARPAGRRRIAAIAAVAATLTGLGLQWRARPSCPVPAGMVRFAAARVRPGSIDRAQRPAVCAAVKPDEDCADRRDPREIPEIALRAFDLDRREVTNRDFASWLDRVRGTWRRNAADPEVIESRRAPSVFLARTGALCGLEFVDGRIRADPDRVDQPATCMTWFAARDYCLAHREHKRLPLDAEWELAAKGPGGRAFPWGSSLPQPDGVAFGRGASTGAHPADVGTSRQDVSPEGVCDLGGNVAEWVESGAGSGAHQLIRGGSWNSQDPCHLLASGCKRITGESLARDVGFRCARTVVTEGEN